MKRNLTNLFVLVALLVMPGLTALAQPKAPQLILTDNAAKMLDRLIADKGINADSAYKLLSNWNNYPEIQKTGTDYIFYYNDASIGQTPMRVYIPLGYRSNVKTGCVLMLHGAVGMSHFKDIDSLYKFDSDILINTLKTQNFIVVRPVADASKKFDWVVNRYSGRSGGLPNLTFKILTEVIITLKKQLNIDDDRVYAFGHSDGSDGAVGLGVFSPDQFAGVVAYNSMLSNIFADDFYIRNIQNRPLYLVHSDLDDLRPIQQARIILDSLRKYDHNILYKEYIGYQHEDKHLDKDVPLACMFMKGISRNPFQTQLYWESQRSGIYNTCDWLKLTTVDTAAIAAPWHHTLKTKAYDKRNKTWATNVMQYGWVKKSAAVQATFNSNVFEIKGSGIKELELLVSPVMVNLEQPVRVVFNGKQVFSGIIKADKAFMLQNFRNTMDRGAFWVNSIKVRVD